MRASTGERLVRVELTVTNRAPVELQARPEALSFILAPRRTDSKYVRAFTSPARQISVAASSARGNWLSALVDTRGASAVGSTAVSAGVSTAELTPGSYLGEVRVTATGAAPLVVPVSSPFPRRAIYSRLRKQVDVHGRPGRKRQVTFAGVSEDCEQRQHGSDDLGRNSECLELRSLAHLYSRRHNGQPRGCIGRYCEPGRSVRRAALRFDRSSRTGRGKFPSVCRRCTGRLHRLSTPDLSLNPRLSCSCNGERVDDLIAGHPCIHARRRH